MHRDVIIELAANLVAPTIALLYLSDEAWLGPVWGLVLALAGPILHTVYTLVRERRVSGLAVLALVSVLLTGGIGLLELDVRWFAWKEMAFPAVIGVACALSAWTPWPAVPYLLASLLDLEKVDALLTERNAHARWEAGMRQATVQIGGVFVATAVLTFGFARWMVVSPTGSEAFNSELGWYTFLAFPVLGVPSSVVMVVVLYRLLTRLEQLTGADFDDLVK